MKTIIITNEVPKNINDIVIIKKEDFVIAVDGALSDVLAQKIRVDLAIGDFDSLENTNLLLGLTKIKLSKDKDETDTFKAVEYAAKKGSNNIVIVGGIKGNRIEHFIANLYLFDKFPNIKIINENSTIYMLEKGSHNIVPNNEYVSFFGYNEAVIDLIGFKYNLDKYNLTSFDPLCISNEVMLDQGVIKVNSGRVIVVLSTKK